MKELGITKGEWQYRDHFSDGIVETEDTIIGHLMKWGSPGEELQANSTLICDAGNTAQKCGLLPSELLRQRDELKEALAEQVEGFVNQEVEKRIAERMPSEMTLEEAEIAAKETDYACFAVELEGNEINFADAAAFYLEGWNACRSRLTNPGVNDSQKTEGGTK